MPATPQQQRPMTGMATTKSPFVPITFDFDIIQSPNKKPNGLSSSQGSSRNLGLYGSAGLGSFILESHKPVQTSSKSHFVTDHFADHSNQNNSQIQLHEQVPLMHEEVSATNTTHSPPVHHPQKLQTSPTISPMQNYPSTNDTAYTMIAPHVSSSLLTVNNDSHTTQSEGCDKSNSSNNNNNHDSTPTVEDGTTLPKEHFQNVEAFAERNEQTIVRVLEAASLNCQVIQIMADFLSFYLFYYYFNFILSLQLLLQIYRE